MKGKKLPMTRKKIITVQGTREDVKKSLKRSNRQEARESSKANPAVQKQTAENGDARAILNLQQTIGNRAVGQLLKGALPAVQRQPKAAQEDKDLVTSTSIPSKIDDYPGKKPEGQLPMAIKPSMGDEGGSSKGIFSLNNMKKVKTGKSSMAAPFEKILGPTHEMNHGENEHYPGSPHGVEPSQSPLEIEE